MGIRHTVEVFKEATVSEKDELVVSYRSESVETMTTPELLGVLQSAVLQARCEIIRCFKNERGKEAPSGDQTT